TGSGTLKYQWRKNSLIIPGATGSSLKISKSQVSDSATYSVVVYNELGATTSQDATLIVRVGNSSVDGLPRISGQPKSVVTMPGSTFSLHVAVGGEGPFFYQWYLDGHPVPSAHLPRLTISDAQGLDSGEYTVRVSNPYGTVTSEPALVTVIVPYTPEPLPDRRGRRVALPTITITPASIAAQVGQTITLHASVQSDLPVVYQWLREGAALLGKTEASLTLANLQPWDAGNYSVVVTHEGGSAVSAVSSVTVAGPPTLPGKTPSKLINLSTRAEVGSGGNVLIGGFIIHAAQPQNLLVRAVGPKLLDFGVAHPIQNPRISLYRGEVVLQENDDWSTDSIQADRIIQTGDAVGAFRLPREGKDAALLTQLESGAYTVVVQGSDQGSGVGLV
ncbi:MAG TPA: immunoglobulin domain-containing protein, partial [Opitutaceae bacterium]|nr:immunoglobulin domain-containing protein [Opitutaceae bacterium]